MKKLVAIFAIMILGGVASVALGYPKICIDPGHGGTDSGAVGYVTEKGINLDASLKFRDWMNLDTSDGGGGYAWVVIMTRSTDITLSLSARTSYANSNAADRFVCIHSNAFNGTANGSETFSYTSGSSTSHTMRNQVQSELISHGGRYNRGNKTATYYVLANTNMPACLTEMAFVDHSGDAACLGNATWRNEVAKGFLHAMQIHYGYAAYTPSSSETKIVDNSDAGFSASANWSTGTSSTDKYGTNYRYRSIGAVTDPANWNVSLASAGTFAVYAWWPQGTNRCNAAPYVVYYSGGSATVNVNQEANGGKWNLLGSWSMNAGSNNVALSCWATDPDVVMADAIKWYK